MSLGYGCRARLEASDWGSALYAFVAYDLNDAEYDGRQGYWAEDLDGILRVDLVMAGEFEYEVENCRYVGPENPAAWDIVRRLAGQIARERFETGSFPKNVAMDW